MNFLPEYTEETLKRLMKKRKELCPYKTEEELFAGLLPDRLVRLLMKQKDPLRSAVDFKLIVKDSLGFDLAQVCSGGVATDEINPSTLESRLHRGLYFAGNFLIIERSMRRL